MTSERLRTVKEEAEHLQVPVGTLYAWSHQRIGPPVIRVGRHLRYRPSDTEKWLDAQAKLRHREPSLEILIRPPVTRDE
jgi:DNA-binding transcriptional MerR regulator